MDNETGYIVAFAVVDKRESDLNSSKMELYGFVRCLYHIITSGMQVAKVCTDQHVMVSKLFSKFVASGHSTFLTDARLLLMKS